MERRGSGLELQLHQEHRTLYRCLQSRLRNQAARKVLALLAVPVQAQMGGGKRATLQTPRTKSRRSTTRPFRKLSGSAQAHSRTQAEVRSVGRDQDDLRLPCNAAAASRPRGLATEM